MGADFRSAQKLLAQISSPSAIEFVEKLKNRAKEIDQELSNLENKVLDTPPFDSDRLMALQDRNEEANRLLTAILDDSPDPQTARELELAEKYVRQLWGFTLVLLSHAAQNHGERISLGQYTFEHS